MTKTQMRALLQELVPLFSASRSNFVHKLNTEVLAQRIPFPQLELAGSTLYEALGSATALTLADELVAGNAMGSYVIAGAMLRDHLPHNRALCWQKCGEYMMHGNEWYTCDILAERVFGQSLLQEFEATVAHLEQCQQHENQWVQRSVGIAVHLAAKRNITAKQADALMQLCLRQVESNAFHVKKGCGWGIETIAKFYPQVAETYRSAILNNPAANTWNKRKLLMGFEKARKRAANTTAKA